MYNNPTQLKMLEQHLQPTRPEPGRTQDGPTALLPRAALGYTPLPPGGVNVKTLLLTWWGVLCTDLTRNTRAPHFTPQHWLLCHMGLY